MKATITNTRTRSQPLLTPVRSFPQTRTVRRSKANCAKGVALSVCSRATIRKPSSFRRCRTGKSDRWFSIASVSALSRATSSTSLEVPHVISRAAAKQAAVLAMAETLTLLLSGGIATTVYWSRNERARYSHTELAGAQEFPRESVPQHVCLLLVCSLARDIHYLTRKGIRVSATYTSDTQLREMSSSSSTGFQRLPMMDHEAASIHARPSTSIASHLPASIAHLPSVVVKSTCFFFLFRIPFGVWLG